MSDLVVTVPKWFWAEWIKEGDAAGESASGEEWGFYLGGVKPPIIRGDRLYIVAHGRLRGYAPVTRVTEHKEVLRKPKWVICREGGAVACTIPDSIKGFQGYRFRWWDRALEVPFPDWKNPDAGYPGDENNMPLGSCGYPW